MKTLPAIICCLAFVSIQSANAQTSYPMIMSLKPVAAQTGQTSEHTIKSRYNLLGADRVFVTGDGVTGEVIPPEIKAEDKDKPQKIETLKIRFTVAPDALPGVRDFRITTPRGASTLGQIVIVHESVTVEADKNDTAELAQQITLPATVCGAIEKAEDVDFFKFKVDAGQSACFHVRSMRLQNRIHDLQQHSDPIIALRNGAGVALASSDNYFYGDPFIHYVFEQEGEYLLEIRDVRYQGNQYWEYSVEISDQPFVTQVFPMGVARGEDAKLDLVGFQLPENPVAELNIPMEAEIGLLNTALLLPSITNPVSLIVSDLPLVTESEDANNLSADAQEISLPAGINGRIESEADIDCFVFSAKKGELYSFEVLARRYDSSLDSQIRILNDQGKQLQLADDMRIGKRNFADSWIENWAAPADGKYILEIRDLHLRGGKEFVYFVNAARSGPYFELYVDTDKTLLTPGTSGAIFVRAERKNGFDGEIQLAVEGLPPAVIAQCGRVLAGKGQDGCIVLSADKDAKFAAANIVISGTADLESADGATKTLSSVAVNYQETYQPGGGRGHWPAQMHTVSIGAPGDIKSISLGSQEISLKPGESQTIDIEIQRADGFDKNVTLDVMYQHLNTVFGNSLPQGVTIDSASSKTLLTKNEIKGRITLKAAADAPPVERQQIVVMANVSINFVMKSTFASQPVFVTVAAANEER